MRAALARGAYLHLSIYSKLHKKLDTLGIQTRQRRDIARVEAAEIRAFDNDERFQELEHLKKQILEIHFVEN